MTLYRPPYALDVLQIPLLGAWLRGRWGRLSLQVSLLLVALALVYDGFFGPDLASRNLATVAPWVHYRGFVIVALLLAGNLFCMACPFTLPRTLAKRLSRRGGRFPALLRHKGLAIASLFTLFVLYEWLDLWASPALTAWVIVAYFVGAFVLEALFAESPFCKYVCPLGTFNFVYSTLAPTQISVKNPTVCATCVGKECINGSYAPQTTIRLDQIPITAADGTITQQAKQITHSPQGALGCGTELFAPQIKSNLDCVYCLDCVRACPHDNAGLFVRPPARELFMPDSWAKRWDVSLLVIILAFMGVLNAFGMIPPMYALQQALQQTFGFTSELPMLILIFAFGGIMLPIGVAWLAGQTTKILTRSTLSLREIVAAFAPSFVPVGFGIWFAHYSFHFLIAPFTLIPILQEFFGQVGEWQRFSGGLDLNWIGGLQLIALAGGFGVSLLIVQRHAQRLFKRNAVPALLPWALVLLLLLLAALNIFTQPMEMRGTAFLFS
jgi:ferredoxin